MQLTILSDKLCKEIGTVDADNLGDQHVVNTRKELCGAFVNEMNVTFVNYTLQIYKKKNSERFCNVKRVTVNFSQTGMSLTK